MLDVRCQLEHHALDNTGASGRPAPPQRGVGLRILTDPTQPILSY
jgi:hypothetical protein